VAIRTETDFKNLKYIRDLNLIFVKIAKKNYFCVTFDPFKQVQQIFEQPYKHKSKPA